MRRRRSMTVRTRMAARTPIKRDMILSDAQVELLTEAVHQLLGQEFVSESAGRGFDTHRGVRFMAVSARCTAERERIGLTVKQAAARIKVPRYRLKAVESGRLSEIRPEVLARYVSFLGLDSWLGRWVKMNGTLATELGIVLRRDISRIRPDDSSRQHGTPSNTALEPSASARSRTPRLSAKR